MPEDHLDGVEAAIAAGAALSDPKEVGKSRVLVIPENWKLQDVSHLLEAPQRIKQTPTFLRMLDFLEYVSRFKQDSLAIWGDINSHAIRATFDYHLRKEPKWCDHTATLMFLRSPSWSAWYKANKQSMGQVAFAEFLEDRLEDITSPDAGKVLDVVTHLVAHKTARITSAANVHNGAHTFSYEEEIQSKGKGQFQVPTILTLTLPIYEGEPRIEVKVRLKYRIDQSGLMFTCDIVRLEELQRSVFYGLMKQVSELTGTPCWLGTQG